MSEWQPISTAPKDGTIILLYIPRAFTYPTKPGYWWKQHGYWRAYGPDAIRPTHWMPLPEPPQ